jgi:hypothetical protein
MPTFLDDLSFLKGHTEIHVLSDGKGREVAVCPKLQGRVFTSTLGGSQSLSHGWINRELVASGKTHPHFSAYGGEDRFWMGPEAGQFALFFAPGTPFDLEHAYVPSAFDKEPFECVEKNPHSIRFSKKMRLPNYAGFTFEVLLDRRVNLLEEEEIIRDLGEKPFGLGWVGFESVNTLTNTGREAWTREKGLVSVWILGMYQPSKKTTVVIPFLEGPEGKLDPQVNDAYFGKVPEGRLKVENGVVYFSADGQCRSKIGISPRRAKPYLGSWDAQNGILTLVKFTLPDKPGVYVNSMWEIQEDPFAGDVANSYNDGPPAPGQKPQGPFFELETSSPAAALAPGGQCAHVHRTLHFAGDRSALNRIAQQKLGATLEEIEKSLPSVGKTG